jgi:hypothetical protein
MCFMPKKTALGQNTSDNSPVSGAAVTVLEDKGTEQ